MGPIVRETTTTRVGAFERFGLPMTGRAVLLSLSGSGIGGHLVEGTVSAVSSVPDAFLVVTGNRGARLRGHNVYDLGVVRENQDLVAAADLVVSTAGKSTIDEATCYGTPIIVIPIRHHAEQERNAAALGFYADDLVRLTTLVRERIGARTPVRRSEGARKAAGLILGLAQRG